MTEYRAQAARDAQAMGYGDERYWAYLDDSSEETYQYYMARGEFDLAEWMMTRSLSEALRGNDGD